MPSNPACPGDEEILEAVRVLQAGGAPEAFGVIFRRFYRPLFKFFANQPLLREEADDLAQATLWRAYQKIGLYSPDSGAAFGAWLRKMAENVWKNAVRGRQADKRTALREALSFSAEDGDARDGTSAPVAAVADPEPSPEQAVLDLERTRVLREAIEALPPGMRRCAELRLFDELKYQEIAALTGIGLNSVRSQLFEVRQRLQPVLDAYFQGADF
jgi:RNA polymerase sigma factor (sigma-70 family)